MKVLITGATGLIGQEIVRVCHLSKIDVHYLSTSKSKLVSEKNYKGFYWNPSSGEIDIECFKDVEVIIHLVGATVAKRWTKAYKQEILASRIQTTSLLLDTLKHTKHTVRHIVSASAIGIYPDSFQNYYMEDSLEKDTGFLGEVVQKWEKAVQEFETLDIEVSLLRIGLVLSDKGGAFPKIASPIKQGMGAVFGDGKQWQSWIHLHDLARLFMFIVEEELTGIFNAVAPNPVSNEKLTTVIANEMEKKIVLPNVPKFMMKLLLGEMHSLLFSSQRVCSNKILQTGFEFTYDNIAQAVGDLVE
ncbi:TIGR01777 family oxidoreductase [Aquimarina sp. 2201CG14-23]|uniref:TIGR01777 family oxidoreductase n=1 Tax=Aquimarina mycalae TaxID=3040073 RepID=UPI0024781B84|nr:TIGR01777 family oxidoreductase [Aquimarina sp. 2201CG14-23]MDH7444472.1 TIGR01777 family oxidoreductase [Aquimarina sp. 2201CG14-23]